MINAFFQPKPLIILVSDFNVRRKRLSMNRVYQNAGVMLFFSSIAAYSQPITPDFVQRGTIAAGTGNACIAAYDYGQSVLGNPAGLSALDTFDGVFNGSSNTPKATLGGFFYKVHKDFALGYSFESYDYPANSSVEVYKNNFSISKQFSGIASYGMTFCTYGLQEDRFQQEGVEMGIIFNHNKTLRTGLLFKSGTKLFAQNGQTFDIPRQGGIGAEYQLSFAGPAGYCNKWEFRLDYLFTDRVHVPRFSCETHEIQFGVKRGLLLLPLYYEKESSSALVATARVVAELVDRLLPGSFGANAGIERFSVQHPLYDFCCGWSDIPLFGNPGQLNCRCDVAIVVSRGMSRNTMKICFGSDFGFRP